MPVLPKQADETECERGGVWSSAMSPPWNCRRPDDSGGLLASDDVAYCCLPTGCPNYTTDPICLSDLGDAVKVSRVGVLVLCKTALCVRLHKSKLHLLVWIYISML